VTTAVPISQVWLSRGVQCHGRGEQSRARRRGPRTCPSVP